MTYSAGLCWRGQQLLGGRKGRTPEELLDYPLVVLVLMRLTENALFVHNCNVSLGAATYTPAMKGRIF